MKYIFILFLLTFFYACSSIAVHSVNSLAKLGDFRSVNDLSYQEHGKNTLDLYIPTGASYEDPAPIIVFFYGGCWGECVSLYKEDYLFVADALTSKGYIVVIADYKMSPEFKYPEIINDAQKVVEWTEKNIDLYFGDKHNIFLMGHSSGAHLAIMLSLNKDYLNTQTRQSIRGGIGLSGPYDFLPYTEPYLTRVFGPLKDAAYSQPINFVHEKEVPLLLMYGKKDLVIKETNIRNLSNKIKDINEDVIDLYYEDLDHQGIIAALSRPRRDKVLLEDINRFIQKCIKKLP